MYGPYLQSDHHVCGCKEIGTLQVPTACVFAHPEHCGRTIVPLFSLGVFHKHELPSVNNVTLFPSELDIQTADCTPNEETRFTNFSTSWRTTILVEQTCRLYSGDTMGHTFLQKILCSNVLILTDSGCEIRLRPDWLLQTMSRNLSNHASSWWPFHACTYSSQWYMQSAPNNKMKAWAE